MWTVLLKFGFLRVHVEDLYDTLCFLTGPENTAGHFQPGQMGLKSELADKSKLSKSLRADLIFMCSGLVSGDDVLAESFPTITRCLPDRNERETKG